MSPPIETLEGHSRARRRDIYISRGTWLVRMRIRLKNPLIWISWSAHDYDARSNPEKRDQWDGWDVPSSNVGFRYDSWSEPIMITQKWAQSQCMYQCGVRGISDWVLSYWTVTLCIESITTILSVSDYCGVHLDLWKHPMSVPGRYKRSLNVSQLPCSIEHASWQMGRHFPPMSLIWYPSWSPCIAVCSRTTWTSS